MKSKIQWNQVNTDTKGTYHSVRIIWLSTSSVVSEKNTMDTFCIDIKIKRSSDMKQKVKEIKLV